MPPCSAPVPPAALAARLARPAASAEDEIGLTGAATLGESAHEDNVSLDDLSPDTLIDDSGARSSLERGGAGANDEALSVGTVWLCRES